MAENKFIERLQGKGTEKSVVEIKNTATPTMFTNMPAGDSNDFNTYSDHRGNATVVANGTMNWKVDSLQTLTPANIVNGNGEDFTTSMATSGAGLWINAEYTFPSTGDPNHPVAMVFNPQTKWILKVCGDNLLSPTSNTIDFTVLITFGSSNIISKTFTVAEQANKFCKEFVIDFAESNTNIIKAQGLSTMKLQLLCGTADASANIYGGMTVLTCLQRKVEAVAISSTFANVEEVLRDGLLPNDYFSNGAYIAQVTDGDTAYAVFQRDGDEMLFVGWNQPIPDQTGNSGKFLMTNGSLMSWEQLTISDVDGLQDDLDDLQGQITTNKGTMDNHIANTNNPHQVTKAQVGLGNVDNTSDVDKPISTATQNALDLKANIADLGTAAYTDSTDYATAAQGALADSALQPGDNVSELVNDAGYLTQHQTLADLGITATASEINVLDGITASTTELNYVDGVTSNIQTQIDSKQPKSTSAYNMGNTSGGWTAMSNAQQDALNSGANTTNIGQIATNASNIADEITNRQNADNGLQSQIDAIVSKSDVVDIVGTYAELQAYDTSSLGNNDVVKVISDSTHNNAPSYYRWVITGGVGAWVYIGSESETYTKAETDALLNAKQDNITATDGITLTGTTLTNSGVRAVASGTANGTISVNTNGTSADVAVTGLGSAAYTNSSAYATAAQGTKADTALQSGDNVSELVNDAGYLVMGDLTNFVTKNTAQTITGLKTFSADIVLSGTTSIKNTTSGVSYTMLYRDTSGIHVGTSTQALLLAGSNARPKFNNNDVAMLSDIPTAVSQLTNDTGFITNAVNNLQNYTLTSNLATVATSGSYNDLSNKPTIPAAQVNSDWNANSGVAQILNKPTLATVATSGSYNDLSNKPTIPTVNNPTITITQGGVTKGSFTLNQSSGDTIALDSGGGGSIDAIDDLTITKNSDDEIQAVATVNANTATGATNPVYDWVGTLAEYNAQDIENQHPDWICYITDDVSGGASVYTKTEVDNNFVGKGHEVIEFQAPTAQNNYTWYRKYADGWVEQGGIATGSASSGVDVNLPVTMANTEYSAIGTTTRTTAATTPTSVFVVRSQKQWSSASSVYFIHTWATGSNSGYSDAQFYWEVKGMAA